MKFNSKEKLKEHLILNCKNKIITGQTSLILQGYLDFDKDEDITISLIDSLNFLSYEFLKITNLEYSIIYSTFVENKLKTNIYEDIEILESILKYYYLEMGTFINLIDELEKQSNNELFKEVDFKVIYKIISHLENEYGI